MPGRSAFWLLVALGLAAQASAFRLGGSCVASRVHTTRAAIRLAAATKKKGKDKGAKAGGFGKVAAAPSGPTAKELLAQASKAYEVLESTVIMGDEVTPITKWSVTVRVDGVAELSDWVPIALLAVKCPDVSDPALLVPSALASARREILEAGSLAVPKLRTAPRDRIEFAFEPLSSFEANVFNALGARSDRRGEAARELGVEVGASADEVKKAHRKLVMQLHPDRFVGDDDGAAAALERMLKVTEAYEELGGGRRGGTSSSSDGSEEEPRRASWYEALGGKMRVSFEHVGTLGKEAAEPWAQLSNHGACSLGVWPLDADVAMDFVARNVVRGS
jgi:hypothetical protein